ncbi:hypothetical protein [Nocardioides sp. AX2bis]|uniref:hypothetical protein n=1 Tax=Nocardioides sp. AX2bis TaxID=2653157 RepID=UPI0012F15073|nr:hypothetical protein [Nocardioides sp. AX2bis]VXC44456.1 hypothetical protein NOCARDAX2BIS_590025 [Nocardioides sp. AX2bis]
MPEYYAGPQRLEELIADVFSPIEDVVTEVERLCRREAGAAEYYRTNAHLQYPNHPWLQFVATGEAEHLGWPRDYVAPASPSPTARHTRLPDSPPLPYAWDRVA